ncbi:hypothetical protein vBEcoMphAPEC6_00290 [Escherichia phage ph0011]|uniref:Uncharacterized protein n=1 Tax=Escherichia phage fEgEco12 TaxID=3158837 RepID=A0AAU7PGH1_9CAUD|nr:hypothetical protein vBEcoMphAPEC6_00290 [Escherichia phage ph0011]
MIYTVYNVLGTIAGVHDNVDGAMRTVLQQVPLKPKTIKQMTARLTRATAGVEVWQDYGDTQIIVSVTKD